MIHTYWLPKNLPMKSINPVAFSPTAPLIVPAINCETHTIVTEYATLFVSIIGVFIAILTVLDIAINKDRKSAARNKRTDWFYGNEEYERKLDDRADKNQYKF